MKHIEHAIALPVAQIVPPLQLAAGSAITMTGAILLLVRLAGGA